MEQAVVQQEVNPADQVATWVSRIFHPLIVVIPTMVIAMIRAGSTIGVSIFWTLLAILIGNLPIAYLLWWGVRTGRYSDASVSIREQRKSLYILGGICLMVLLAVLILGNAPVVLSACLLSGVIATIVGFGINHYTKLSLHSVGMAGCTAVLLWFAPVIGIFMAFFMPVVGWARIRLKHHTPVQILIGWMVSMLSVFVVFTLML